MKKVKRVARKIGQDDEEEQTVPQAANVESAEPISAVRRPVLSSLKSAKPHRASSLRRSIAAAVSIEDSAEDGAHAAGVTKTLPRRTNLSRQILERNAEFRTAPLPMRTGSPEGRPSYNSDYLAELRKSTPSTPRDVTLAPNRSGNGSLDITSKFGADALLQSSYDSRSSVIPTDAEIQEKKERRRRLAKEQDFISLDDRVRDEDSQSEASEDSDYRTKSLIVPAEEVDLNSKYGETRLEHEDEDIAEGFDSFVEDAGKVTLGRKAAKEQEAQRKRDIAEQIRSAQHGYGYRAGVSDDDDDQEEDEVDEEEVARNAAYEAAQTRAGMYGTSANRQQEKSREESLKNRLEILPKLRPIPDLKSVVGQFWDTVKAKEAELVATRKRLEALEREQVDIALEEVSVKQLLREAGERFEKLQAENLAPSTTKANEEQGPRGLDSLGILSAKLSPAVDEQAMDDNQEDDAMDESEEEIEPVVQTSMADMFPGMRVGGFSGMGSTDRIGDDY